MNKYKYLETKLKSGVFYIELTRKKSMNALNTKTLDELKNIKEKYSSLGIKLENLLADFFKI